MPEKVTIIAERPWPLPTESGVSRQMIQIVYQAAGDLPRTVYVDPDHDSPEERARVIRADLDAARNAIPATIELPDVKPPNAPRAAR